MTDQKLTSTTRFFLAYTRGSDQSSGFFEAFGTLAKIWIPISSTVPAMRIAIWIEDKVTNYH